MVYTLIQITRERYTALSSPLYSADVYLHSSKGLLSHDVEEVVEGHSAISVGVSTVNHLLELLVSHGLTELAGNATQVSQGDGAGVVVVEQAEYLRDVLSGVLVAHAGGHHVEELLEVDSTALVLV